MPLETTLGRRRSLREFSGAALALADLGQLLWAAQGTTGGEGQRTAPSAGALYPLEVYVVAGVSKVSPRAAGATRRVRIDCWGSRREIGAVRWPRRRWARTGWRGRRP
jgi:hypothetical protein